MKKIIFGLLLSVLLTALAPVQVEGMKIILTKMDEQTVSGDLLEVKNDSIVLMPGRLANVEIPVDEIKYLLYEKNAKSSSVVGKVLAGMAIGTVIFAAINQTTEPRYLLHGAVRYGLPISALLVFGSKNKGADLKKVSFYGETSAEKRNHLLALRPFAIIKN